MRDCYDEFKLRRVYRPEAASPVTPMRHVSIPSITPSTAANGAQRIAPRTRCSAKSYEFINV